MPSDNKPLPEPMLIQILSPYDVTGPNHRLGPVSVPDKFIIVTSHGVSKWPFWYFESSGQFTNSQTPWLMCCHGTCKLRRGRITMSTNLRFEFRKICPIWYWDGMQVFIHIRYMNVHRYMKVHMIRIAMVTITWNILRQQQPKEKDALSYLKYSWYSVKLHVPYVYFS